jgi:hypothetical protein
MLNYLNYVAFSGLDFCSGLGVDFNLFFCYEIPRRGFEAEERKREQETMPKGG